MIILLLPVERILRIYILIFLYIILDQLEQGGLFLLDLKEKKFKNLELKNFPKNLNFFPHGMELYKNKYIYVINHSLNSIDGERFEIFEIIKEKNDVKYLNYIRSIKLPEEFHTATNGLAVAEKMIFSSLNFFLFIPLLQIKLIFLIKLVFIQ